MCASLFSFIIRSIVLKSSAAPIAKFRLNPLIINMYRYSVPPPRLADIVFSPTRTDIVADVPVRIYLLCCHCDWLADRDHGAGDAHTGAVSTRHRSGPAKVHWRGERGSGEVKDLVVYERMCFLVEKDCCLNLR